MNELNFSDCNLNSFDFLELEFSKIPSPTQNQLVNSPLKKRNHITVNTTNPLFPNIAEIILPSKKVKMTPVENSLENGVIRKSTSFNVKIFSLSFSKEYVATLEEELQEQVNLIITSDSYLTQSPENKEKIHSVILTICEKNLSTNEKCAELGVMYFYITTKKEFYGTESFLQSRISEIELEARNLKNEHKIQCPEHLRKLLPSGCQAYLMRAFVRMVFLPDGRFNPGGCKALIIIMNSRLNLLITDEGRTQIIKATNCLLEDPSFLQLFMEPLEIHKDLENLIKIDIKLSNEKSINAIYVRWDLLMAFFSPIGQINGEGNCFALATTAHFLNDHSKEVLKLLIQVLKSGKLLFEEKEFPVATLLESHRHYEKDFESLLPYDIISQMTSFSMTKERIQLSEIKNEQKGDILPLYETMQRQFGSETEYAKQLFLSLKQNLLQKLMLSITQFVAINITELSFNNFDKKNFLSIKDLLIHALGNSVILNSKSPFDLNFNDKVFIEYLQNFKDILRKSLYLIDCKDWAPQFNSTDIISNYNQIVQFYLNQFKYNSFREVRRIFILKNGELNPIDSISKLKDYFLEFAGELQTQNNSEISKIETIKIINFINSSQFRTVIANTLVWLNRDNFFITPEEYQKSDLCFLKQLGSPITFIEYWKPFKTHFNPPINIVSTNATEFFKNISTTVAQHAVSNPDFLKKTPEIIIASKTHVFILKSFPFKEYWQGNLNEIIEEKILNRAIKIQTLTAEKKIRALMHTVGYVQGQLLYHKFDSNHLGISQFSEKAKKFLPIELHSRLEYSIDLTMNEIPLDEVRKKLWSVLSGFIKNTNIEPYFQTITEKIAVKASGHTHVAPYPLAKWIHKALITSNPSIFTTKHKLEKNIREVFSRPEVIDLANLNWIGDLCEKPSYSHLSLKYDFNKKNLTLCKRKDGIESPLDDEFISGILSDTTLYFPT